MEDDMYTKGPWVVEANADKRTGTVIRAPSGATDSKPNPAVAKIPNQVFGYGTEAANAKLIAAAPELLEALQNSLQYIIAAHHEGRKAGLSAKTLALAERDFEKAQAAIKKATE